MVSKDNNQVYLAGKVKTSPVFSHKVYGEAFYIIILGMERMSGYEDEIRLLVSEKLMHGRSPRKGEFLEISGQIRTYNKEEDGRTHLEVTVFAKKIKYVSSLEFCYENNVYLEGFICKEPVRRKSPLGREICDLMIAVNRMYNKSDYIPTIAWGRNAYYCGNMRVGDKVVVEGRIQSRNYRKYTEEGYLITKTAYEVSAMAIEQTT